MNTSFQKRVVRLFCCLFFWPGWLHGAEGRIPALGDAHGTDQSYKLVWQEEFSGTKLDRKKWVAVDDPKIGQYGHGNGESQAYLDAEGETFFIKDGRLTIIAHYAPDAKYPLRDKPCGKFKRNIDHQDFKSAKLTTEKLRAFTYGIFEARIKNPTDARGQRTAIPVWPAFWLMPEAETAPYSGYWDQAAAKGNVNGPEALGRVAKLTLWKCQVEPPGCIMPAQFFIKAPGTGPWATSAGIPITGVTTERSIPSNGLPDQNLTRRSSQGRARNPMYPATTFTAANGRRTNYLHA